MSEQTTEPHSIGDVVEVLDELADAEDSVSFGDVLDKFGSRSFAPVMMIIALTEATPLGAIPGVPSLLALLILLIAVQMIMGRGHIWVPKWIENRSVASQKLDKATDKVTGVADKLDNVAKGRMEGLAKGPALRVAAAIIIALCLMVPPLEVLPWASSGPMLAIAMISLAIMVRDGLAMLIAWIIAGAAAVGMGYYYLSSDAAGGGFLPF
ncbi:exopolysaccharide biosynthesis protein [Erythrobacter sp. MTPC3]|uniref:exopolysaccharide biosynthesis protein n=1 Tax=Erythrobacter sp. MTPC3 TaxID=3056564 RepID=UPI0036F1C18B